MSKSTKLFYLILLIYIISFPIIPTTLEFKSISLGDIMFFIVILFYLFLIITLEDSRKRVLRGLKDFFKDYTTLSMFLLALIMLLSVSYAKEKTLALTEGLRFIYYIILYFIIKYEVNEKMIIDRILKGYLISSAVISIFGIIQYFTKIGLDKKFIYDPKYYSVPIRITSTLDNPNSLGAFLVLAIFPSIMLVFYAKSRREKWIYSIFSILIFANIMLSFSRNAWLAFGLGIAILFFIVNWKMVIITGAVLSSSIFIPSIRNRLGDFSAISDNERILMWKTAIKMIKDHPIVGVGNGNFVSLYDEYVTKYPELAYNHNKRFPSHNSYLKVQSELGILGIVVFVLIILSVLIKIKKVIALMEDKFHKAFYKGFFISILAFLLMNIADNLFFIPKITMSFWILVAISQSINYNDICINK